jgi:hypothetical protein
MPTVCPAANVHTPVQQLAPAEQASPGCAQNEDGWQVPPAHLPEQHSPLDVQALPNVLQAGLRGTHVPPVQF